MNYHNITYPDMNNGDGLRVVLWLSGCSHNCNQCQNPQTWNPESGIEFDIKAETELFTELSRDYISGLTLSGGDPMYYNNLDSVIHLLQQMRILFKNNKTIWLYTGYTFEQCLVDKKRNNILKHIDVMIDGRFENDKKDLSLKFRGSSNQRVIDVQKSLETGEIVGLCTD